MVKFLVDTVWAARVGLGEVAGAGLLVAGFALWLGAAAALIVGGVCLLAKSFEWDVRSGEQP